MKNQKINLIAAIQKKDRGIGYQNKLLFRIADDLKRFRSLTKGNIVIMGRKTFESIGHALPERVNIVISRNPEFRPEGVTMTQSLEQALAKAREFNKEIFIIGGGEIYKQTIGLADRLYLTLVDSDFPADTFFPEWSEFKKIISQEKGFDEKNNLSYEYLTLEKS